MKYVCLCYTEEAKYEHMPEAELEALLADQVSYDATLRSNGTVVVSEALESVRLATTVRIRGGKLAVTDGPFAETKEQLGGFFLIEAEDLDEAIRIASGFPSLRAGTIEIRPVWDIRQHVRAQRIRHAPSPEEGNGVAQRPAAR